MLRNAFSETLRYWEPRRLAYNLALAILASAWVLLTWPHFQPALTLPSLLKLAVLVALANLCYCAAYLVDVPLRRSSFGIAWRRRRWVLWLVGTCFALLITCYWIADEIYPFVGAV